MATCWGWGTWKSAWDKLEEDPDKLSEQLSQRCLLKEFNLNGRCDFAMQLFLNKKGVLDTWAIKWYASILLNDGYSLHPGKTLVDNVGLAKGGTHTGGRYAKIFKQSKMIENLTPSKVPVLENRKALEAYKKFRTSYMPALLRPFYFSYTQNGFSRFVLNSLFLMKRKLKL